MVMKYFRSMLFAAAVLAFGMAAYAQETMIKAEVPFSFMVGDKLYPAGEYSVAQAARLTKVLEIRNKALSQSKVFQTITCSTPAPKKATALVFERTGDVYSLSQIWVAGSEYGWEIRHQAVTEARLAFNAGGAEAVIVAANLIHR
jgi:hypothetical protein